MKKPTKTEIEKAWNELQKAKAAYKKWGELTEAMAELGIDSIKTKSGLFLLVDKFAEKNTVYKPAFVSRYEVEFKKGA